MRHGGSGALTARNPKELQELPASWDRFAAAFASDPGKSGRPLAAWLRRATPMETETASVTDSVGSQPSKRAKKSRGSRAQAPPVA